MGGKNPLIYLAHETRNSPIGAVQRVASGDEPVVIVKALGISRTRIQAYEWFARDRARFSWEARIRAMVSLRIPALRQMLAAFEDARCRVLLVFHRNSL